MPDGEVFGHEVEREIRGSEVWYRCVTCDLAGEYAYEFEQHGCDEPPPEPDDDADPPSWDVGGVGFLG